ncbi:hypothetical protein ACLRE7_00275 [Mycoplasmopsis meleagridis]|uniref:hypothetical protein n=1 Tax=Mycoplasmopsis meleagridis TaxID=29561 RepID=UPI003A8A9583
MMAQNRFLKLMKEKIFNKKNFYVLLSVSFISALAASLTYKYNNPFKPTFYNYKQYIEEDIKKDIEKEFDYKEFDTLNQFTVAILTNKAIAGIGSDSQAVTLIKKDKLQKIDFYKLFPETFNNPENKNKKVDEILKSLYSDVVWNHLVSYDDDLKTDEFGHNFSDGPRHLWEYFVPYFAQDMVIAYNPSKILNLDSYNFNLEDYYALDKKIIKEVSSQRENDPSWSPWSMYSILKVLKENGFNNLEITDAVRDNMIYGSAYHFDKETGKYTNDLATGQGQDFGQINDINKFIKLFNEHLKEEYKNDNLYPNNVLKLSELQNDLNNFVNKTQNGYSNFKELIDQFSNLIKNSTGYKLNDEKVNFIGNGLELVDRLISPASEINVGVIYNGDTIDAYSANDNNSSVRDGVVRYLRPKDNLLLVDGLVIVKDTNEKISNKIYDLAKNTFLDGIDLKQEEYDKLNDEQKLDLGAIKNFDTVGYTVAYKRLVDYVKNEYFNYIKDQETPESMQNIDDVKWNKYLDYEVAYVNNLFDINDVYKVWKDESNPNDFYSYKVVHHSIKPVDQKALTDIETYWNLQIKK